ncbi:hypothetical protein EVA_19936 [gut metagenome]|uniref:Uncharacterized protein n=1 Tax=gut metagenome TaxID=749906 RepID=J9FAL9_9ZZZZ
MFSRWPQSLRSRQTSLSSTTGSKGGEDEVSASERQGNRAVGISRLP